MLLCLPGILINMGKTMLLARQCLYFGLFLNIQSVASQTTVNGHVGQEVKIPCSVGGSYTLPQWSKGAVSLTSQDVPGVNPAYPRFSYDTDMRTLVVSSAQEDDSGTYECTHTGGTTPPQNTIVVITEATTSNVAPTSTVPASTEVITPNNTQGSSKQKGFSISTMIIIIACSCSAAAIVVIIVLVLIRRKKKQKEKKFPNKNLTFQNKTVMSQNENVMFSNEAQNEPVTQSISTPGLQG